MSSAILVKVTINSACETALAWKCCNLMDLNLEVQVWNAGEEAVKIKSEILFSGPRGEERIDYFYPHGLHLIPPRDALSFYCNYDENRFSDFSWVILTDGEGKKLKARITGDKEPAAPLPPDGPNLK